MKSAPPPVHKICNKHPPHNVRPDQTRHMAGQRGKPTPFSDENKVRTSSAAIVYGMGTTRAPPDSSQSTYEPWGDQNASVNGVRNYTRCNRLVMTTFQ